MKAIHQLISYFQARGRITAVQMEKLIAKGYYQQFTKADIHSFQSDIGKSFLVEATGRTSGSIWGTDVYTSDSCVDVACVHAGVLKNNETAIVKITIVKPLKKFKGSTRNGVTSSDWGSYPAAYKVESMDE
jgi:hypothetical protein